MVLTNINTRVMIIYPNLVFWYRAKLLGAGTESFRTDFVELRATKACASSLPTLEHLPPALSYLDHPPLLCQRASRMDEIIDHALLPVGGFPPEMIIPFYGQKRIYLDKLSLFSLRIFLQDFKINSNKLFDKICKNFHSE